MSVKTCTSALMKACLWCTNDGKAIWTVKISVTETSKVQNWRIVKSQIVLIINISRTLILGLSWRQNRHLVECITCLTFISVKTCTLVLLKLSSWSTSNGKVNWAVNGRQICLQGMKSASVKITNCFYSSLLMLVERYRGEFRGVLWVLKHPP